LQAPEGFVRLQDLDGVAPRRGDVFDGGVGFASAACSCVKPVESAVPDCATVIMSSLPNAVAEKLEAPFTPVWPRLAPTSMRTW